MQIVLWKFCIKGISWFFIFQCSNEPTIRMKECTFYKWANLQSQQGFKYLFLPLKMNKTTSPNLKQDEHKDRKYLLGPANWQCVVVICLLGVMIRPHFIDVKSHIVPLLVACCPAGEQAQYQDAVQLHGLLRARWEASSSTAHKNPLQQKNRQIVRLRWMRVIETRLLRATKQLCDIEICRGTNMKLFPQQHG